MSHIHHANVLIGKGDSRTRVTQILKQNFDFEIRANPDFYIFEEESFGIDTSRSLVEWMQGKPLLGEVKAALIIAQSLTIEAQNALLKAFEEPPLGTFVFLHLPQAGNLLPTFLSRVSLEELSGVETEKSYAKKFLDGDIGERLRIVRTLAKDEDKTEMKNLIDDLATRRLALALKAKILLSAKGASPKMLLEWLANVI